jgi:uncharacterized protein (DUF1697 family)
MTRWIALFRGINVGGNNLLPMKQLILDLEAMKLQNIKTYIQSGNVVFDSGAKDAKLLAKSIGERIEREHGFLPQVLLLSLNDLQRAIRENPFPEAISDPPSLHFFFLEQPARSPNITALDAAKAATENYVLTDRVLYLHAPDGVGRSKLAATAEKKLGVTATARNYRTVEKLLALASES